MRLPDFTAEASLYRTSEAYHAMVTAGLARGREVTPSFVFSCIFCDGRLCCPNCAPGLFPHCGPGGHCGCIGI